MSEAKVIFTLNEVNITIKCATEDKMEDICKSYSIKINQNMNSLLFLYEGNKVNFGLSFKEQANLIDRNNNEMKVLVNKIGNNIFICPKYDEKINLNSEKLDEIIVSNNEIKDNIIGINLQTDNIIKTSSMNSLNIHLKNDGEKLNMVAEDIKNNEKLHNLFDDYININNNNNLKISNTFKSNPNYESVDCLKNKNLLENIKSIFFSRIIFSYLDEKIKLKIIKYNKKLKNKIDIKLINYKFYSGKYIIYETNIKGKEYDGQYGDLIFEGEYLNGERNGKGKEYDCHGNLEFEGEYLKGKRHGKGKEYSYENGKLKFEGEYLNGEKNGKGKEYYNNGLLKFEGEYLNGERIIGKLYDNNGNIYCDLESAKGLIKEYYDDFDLMFEGEYLNGKRNGKGREFYGKDILLFEGEYLNGKEMEKEKNIIIMMENYNSKVNI